MVLDASALVAPVGNQDDDWDEHNAFGNCEVFPPFCFGGLMVETVGSYSTALRIPPGLVCTP